MKHARTNSYIHVWAKRGSNENDITHYLHYLRLRLQWERAPDCFHSSNIYPDMDQLKTYLPIFQSWAASCPSSPHIRRQTDSTRRRQCSRTPSRRRFRQFVRTDKSNSDHPDGELGFNNVNHFASTIRFYFYTTFQVKHSCCATLSTNYELRLPHVLPLHATKKRDSHLCLQNRLYNSNNIHVIITVT